MKTLPKLSDYNKKIIENTKYRDKLDYRESAYNKLIDIENYTNFITQPLKLSHFAPTIEKDGKWIVLEKPKHNGKIGLWSRKKVYKLALDNCIFKGCEIKTEVFVHGILHYYIQCGNLKIMWNFNDKWEFYKEFTDIESVIPYNLEVNENIIKKFGL